VHKHYPLSSTITSKITSYNRTWFYLIQRAGFSTVNPLPGTQNSVTPVDHEKDKIRRPRQIAAHKRTHRNEQPAMIKRKDRFAPFKHQYDKEVQKCSEYCTAEEYNFDDLIPYLRAHNISWSKEFADDVIYIKWAPSGGEGNDVFIFDYGCVVCWGMSPQSEEKLIETIKPFSIKPNKHFSDEMEFYYDEKTDVKSDRLVLPQNLGEEKLVGNKLAFSYSLMRSVKLDYLENQVWDLIESLNANNSTGFSLGFGARSRSSEKISQFMFYRGLLNHYNDLLETPEFYWDAPQVFEHLFDKLEKNLSISDRVEVLNKQLDYGVNVAEIRHRQLNDRVMERLEIIIIIVITAELLLALFNRLFPPPSGAGH